MREVGIGTTSPSEKLTVNGNVKAQGTVYADTFVLNNGGTIGGGHWEKDQSNLYYNAGYVGIGVVPTVKLDVRNNDTNPAARFASSTYDGATIEIETTNSNSLAEANITFKNTLGTKGSIVNRNGDFEIWSKNYSEWKQNLLIKEDGRIGMGTQEPKTDYRLTVAGGIYTDRLEIRDDISIFPNTYKTQTVQPSLREKRERLKPLSELDTYIREKNHLPNLVSAQEAYNKGVNVGTMQVRLLEKIEELTLYIIEQDKKIKELEKKVNNR